MRLIAVNDNVDTGRGENDFTPMMNLFNEWFVKNTSKKIRAVWQAKGKSGERLAVIPPYGYRKDPDNPKQLVIDEESATNVRRIFRLSVEGYGPAQIARLLNNEHILNPSGYKYEHGIVKKARPCKDPYFWNTTTVHKILDAPEYLGLTINFKTWSKSYKDNRPRLNPPEKQLVFEDTHPAIIDPETWDIVRSMRQHKRRARAMASPACSPEWSTVPTAAQSCTSTPGQSKTSGEHVTRVRIAVPNTVRTFSIRASGNAPATLFGKANWNSLY